MAERTFSELVSFLTSKYGPRMALYVPGIESRLLFLSAGTYKLEDAVVDGIADQYPARLASLFTRVCSIAELLRIEELYTQAMGSKYPRSHCVYCGYKQCRCPQYGRVNSTPLREPDAQTREFTLTDWVVVLDIKYGQVNRERGIHWALHRLYSEQSELAMLLQTVVMSPKPSDDVRWWYAEELADVTAWIIACAVILEVDLETAVQERYGGNCGKCRHFPCRCGPPDMDERRQLWQHHRAPNER